jgi:dihydroxyacetone kinase-like protein
MESFSNSEGLIIIKNLIKEIQDNKQYLSDIDGQIGDGDHGINMNKGFTLCEEHLEANPNLNLTEGLNALSKILMMKIGGSMGPLYGFFFKSMAEKCSGKDYIHAKTFEEMVKAIPNDLSKITKAKPGDKTLMDCLIPAVEAYSKSLESGENFKKCLEQMCLAANIGKDSTKDLISKVGRSSRLGERSIGVIDAGAASCSIILCSISKSIIELLK